MNLSEVEESLQALSKDGFATQKDGKWTVDLTKMGVDKLLGSGRIGTPLTIKVGRGVREGARRSSKKAGGNLDQRNDDMRTQTANAINRKTIEGPRRKGRVQMAEGEEKKSMLYKLKPVTDRLPAVTRPEGHVHFRTKMMWIILILVLYFAMTNIVIYGLDQEQGVDLFAQYRAILAGAQFSLMHLGIGPIVTGSIIMQLFTGAKIIKLNLKDDEDKAVYQGTQKLLVIIMILVEAVPQVYGFMEPSTKFVDHDERDPAGQRRGARDARS